MDVIPSDKNDMDHHAVSFYVGWEEVWVCGEKGNREVHYYLKKRDGSADLAVVGKEKSLRHISYRYVVPVCDKSNRVYVKLKSRREVIDWLCSIAPVSDAPFHRPLRPIEEYAQSEDGHQVQVNDSKDSHFHQRDHNFIEFTWLGSPWTCRKKRMHYPSFRRNGVHICAHDFVYVLAEENKRLVAYLEDMYEDSRGNKMVMVRWFHRIDEVGIVLPENYNDREIFFSLCLQDLSIECIDGLASVLSPQHYEKFMKKARHTQFEPFVCHMLFENDDVKPFEVTQVKGYWKQDILRYLSLSFPSNGEQFEVREETYKDAAECRPKKRLRRSSEVEGNVQPVRLKSGDVNLRNHNGKLIGFEGNVENLKLIEGVAPASTRTDAVMQKHEQYLTIGSLVEVLCQDSGIRGCWYRALIVKRYKDKVKVQYQDIKDAADETKNLQEWISASRLAVPDEFGIRIFGRSIVRPIPSHNQDVVSFLVNVGSIVDAWWHDGWWEGIVVKKVWDDKLYVFFPGEKQEVAFSCGELRYSQEWLVNEWKGLKERPDIVSTLSLAKSNLRLINSSSLNPDQLNVHDEKDCIGSVQKDSVPDGNGGTRVIEENKSRVVQDLLKDDFLSQLRWKSSGKRCGRSPLHKVQYGVEMKRNGAVDTRRQTSERFLISSSMKVDSEHCKFSRDSPFSSSAVSYLTSLVMSR